MLSLTPYSGRVCESFGKVSGFFKPQLVSEINNNAIRAMFFMFIICYLYYIK